MLLSREDIIETLRNVGLPQGSFVVFGSGPLAMAGIRKTADIDLVVSPRVFDQMEQLGWESKHNSNGDHMMIKGNIEAYREWRFRGYHAMFEDLKATADVYRGIMFVNLHEVRKWKQNMSRPKDFRDIEMIDDYLAKHGWS